MRIALAAALAALLLGAPAAAAPPRALITGDSMMLVLRRALTAELTARGAEVHADARVGSGITKPDVVEWTRLSAQQARRLRPDVTVVWLGAGDVFDLPRAPCCGERWVAAYARRVGRMTRAYGRVFWLTLPAPRDPELARIHRAVNRAVRRAAPVIDLGPVFSPGGRFRRTLRWDGRTQVVRAKDGVHLTQDGSRIAAAVIGDALAAAGALSPDR